MPYQDNCITTLRGSLRRFKFLEVLDVSNNSIRSLGDALQELAHLQFLRYVNLKVGELCSDLDAFSAAETRQPTYMRVAQT